MRLHMSFFFVPLHAKRAMNNMKKLSLFILALCSLLFVPSLQQRGPSKKGHWSFNVPIE